MVGEMLPGREALCQVLITFLLSFGFMLPTPGRGRVGRGQRREQWKIIEQGENERSLNSRIQEDSFHMIGL